MKTLFSRTLFLSLALAGCAPAVFAQDAPISSNAYAVVAAAPRPIDAGQTKALANALKNKDWDAARVAVQSGADVNLADKGGVTALMRAADGGQSELVQLLVQNGANVNALDKKGQSVLHYAVPAAPKPKKNFGFGQLTQMLGPGLGALGGNGGGLGALLGGGGLGNLLGGNLTSLLSGGAFNLGGKSGWSAIIGSALQGDANGKLGIGSLLSGAGAGKLNAGGWTSLLSSVKGSNPQVLGAMGNLGAGGNATQSALWNQFLNAASSGDNATVESLMGNPELVPLLQQAQSGLSSAAGELPGNAARTIISTLTQNGANAGALDKDGVTATALAQARGLSDLFSRP